MSDPKKNQLYRFKEVAYDVALGFGNTTEQGKAQAMRYINRAAPWVARGKRWSWRMVKDSFNTSASVEEYSLNQDVGRTQMFWIEESNRQKLDRIPSRKFRELEPDPTDVTGIPRMYDFNGVDSSGCKVVTLYPLPSSQLTIHYRYERLLLPIQNEESSIWGLWGMPPDIINILIEYAVALYMRDRGDSRADSRLAQAEAMLADAYGDDQENVDTTIRIPFDDGDGDADDVQLPPNYSR